ncbi:hypothetical protein [Psychromonas sp. MME2]|uniref:hypothetical protein n=1 Tax=Psychromonas sp. MME2 TaxID=3231033 RepID=UPI00339BA06E
MRKIFSLLIAGIIIMPIHNSDATTDTKQTDTVLIEENSNWKDAKESTNQAVQKSTEAAKDVWQATKKSSSEILKEGQEKSAKIWQSTKQGSQELWSDSKETTQDIWDKLKRESEKAWQKSNKKIDELMDEPATEPVTNEQEIRI